MGSSVKRSFHGSGLTLTLVILLASSAQSTHPGSGEKIEPNLPVPYASDEHGDTQCAFKNIGSSDGPSGVVMRDSISKDDISIEDGKMFISNCKSCYTLWNERSDELGRLHKEIIGQGCWLPSEGCSESKCVMRAFPSGALSRLNQGRNSTSKAKFCCCQGDRCNVNVSVVDDEERKKEISTEDQVSSEEKSSFMLVILSAVFGIFCFFCGIFAFAVRYCFHPEKCKSTSPNISSCEDGNSSSNQESKTPLLLCTASSIPDFSSNLRIETLISKGRFSSVYKGFLQQDGVSLNGKREVAVKVFTKEQRQCFLNEKSVYEMRHLNNEDCLMEFFGAREDIFVQGVRYDSLLVLSYAEHGSLASYLKHKTVSWPQLCKMLLGISQGLSHLHSDSSGNNKGDGMRPSVCHRDLNSRNILVQSDLTCRICDFGFAQLTPQSSLPRKSLEEVGSVRYLSPELLEGAVNLRDCEASLRQADVYAMGLLFWEASMRCHDLYQGSEVPAFSLAFSLELLHSDPTCPQMQILVSKNKARPLFPPIWKSTNPAVQLLRETIEYCWDADAEARLTALCVVERVSSMPILWERYKAGKTEANTRNNCGGMRSQGEVQRMNAVNSIYQANDILPPRPHSLPSSSSRLDITSPPNRPSTNSPSSKNANVISGQRVLARLQPHQGSNPCKERNLMAKAERKRT